MTDDKKNYCRISDAEMKAVKEAFNQLIADGKIVMVGAGRFVGKQVTAEMLEIASRAGTKQQVLIIDDAVTAGEKLAAAFKEMEEAERTRTAGQRAAEAMANLTESFKTLEAAAPKHQNNSIPNKHRKKRKFHS